ncbi:hypothetical protein BaRGS_00009145 [Batillaria attramentaria]|uniref:Uncharacterized protein n=1 Tax=Batillaria attramentaria TaxID=370345 RepID=A0ABD0LJ94_9CAEN
MIHFHSHKSTLDTRLSNDYSVFFVINVVGLNWVRSKIPLVSLSPSARFVRASTDIPRRSFTDPSQAFISRGLVSSLKSPRSGLARGGVVIVDNLQNRHRPLTRRINAHPRILCDRHVPRLRPEVSSAKNRPPRDGQAPFDIFQPSPSRLPAARTDLATQTCFCQ